MAASTRRIAGKANSHTKQTTVSVPVARLDYLEYDNFRRAIGKCKTTDKCTGLKAKIFDSGIEDRNNTVIS